MKKVFWVTSTFLALLSISTAQTVTADFGSHLSTAYPISSTLLGTQYSNPMPSAPLTSTYNAGFRVIRMHGWLQSVYATRSANWTKLDPYLDAIKNLSVGNTPGFKVILELTYTPPWLVPTVSGCPAPTSSAAFKIPPDNVSTWANLAQSIVEHVDQKYPGLVTDFEIWNEPELGTFCVFPNTAGARLSRYLSLYAAAAPLIRAQAAKDRAVVRIGGPTIVSTGAITEFIGGLVNNASTAPYVDFVSYHKYPSGQSDVDGGMAWDHSSSSGVSSLYSRVQSSSTTGFAGNYISVANVVKTGKQPNPTKTKIYLDEFNDNWAFSDDCCRNTSTYSPVFNGLVLLDMLDSVYKGAQRPPDSIEYYSDSNPPFCLIGDTGMHCGAKNYSVNYPQYYLYSLFASSTYLNLSAGTSYMAKSISPLPSTSGLAATAFWSASQDSVVVVNPSSTSYSSVKVVAQNPGFTIGHATAYLLNSTHKTITASTLTLSNVATPPSSSVTVSVPAYSVIVVKLTS